MRRLHDEGGSAMKIVGGSCAAPIVTTMEVMTTGIEITLAILIHDDVVINYTLSEGSASSTTTGKTFSGSKRWDNWSKSLETDGY